MCSCQFFQYFQQSPILNTDLGWVEFICAISCGNHMNDVIVSIIADIDFIPLICNFHLFPFFCFNVSWCVHNASITDYLLKVKKNHDKVDSEVFLITLTKQFLLLETASSKYVFSIWIIVLRRFSWNLNATMNDLNINNLQQMSNLRAIKMKRWRSCEYNSFCCSYSLIIIISSIISSNKQILQYNNLYDSKYGNTVTVTVSDYQNLRITYNQFHPKM